VSLRQPYFSFFSFLSYFSPFIVLFEDEGVNYAVSCEKYADSLEEELLLPDNITGYEDIPDYQRENLSNETRKSLKELPDFFYNDATSFNSLSDKQKTIFKKKVLNDTLVSFDKPLNAVVFYQEAVYRCQSDGRRSGA